MEKYLDHISSKHLTSLPIWGVMYLQTENIGMKITQANNGYMGKQQTHTHTNSYCSGFTDDSETKKQKLQWTPSSMNEISVWEQCKVFCQISLAFMTLLPIFSDQLLLLIPAILNLIDNKLFLWILSNKIITTALCLLKSQRETGFSHS